MSHKQPRDERTSAEGEEQFRQFAESVPDAFWITSPDFKLHYVSEGYALIWGRSTESLYSHPREWLDAILPEERERVCATLATLKENETNVTAEYRIARPDGTVRWVQHRGFQVRDAAGNVVRLTGIVADITEPKRMAAELLVNERRFSDAVRNLELASMMLDRDAQITYCNDYLLRLTGWSREEVIGRNWFELFLPPDNPKELRDVNSASLEDQPAAWHHESDIITRSGARHTIRWNTSVLRSASGDVIGTASIGEDVTERRRLDAELFQFQKMETVGRLAGAVAHEFNNIMTAIIGQSELLLDNLPHGNPLCTNVTEIRLVAESAATLTRQLLAYGRKQVLTPRVFDLNSVLTGMEGTLRHLMGSSENVCIKPAAGLKAVKADALQIEQVIMNIAVNAADAMPHGGKLTIATANASFDEQHAGPCPELKPGDYAVLSITDTGVGMSKEVRSRVFEPFFTTKGPAQGAGLGLSTCYGIIKQSGGDISVSSEPARGSTFKIYLPQVDQSTTLPAWPLEPSELPRGTETILFVEDDPALREMAAILLKRLGYTVLSAGNGIDALRLIQQPDVGVVDLLFADVIMPRMGGIELSERIKALFPRTRVLFTSAYTENAIVERAVSDNGVSLLQKPFTPSAMAHKLREMLDEKPLRD